MANQLNINRTILIILLLLVLVTLVIAAFTVIEVTSVELIAKAAEGSGGVFGTINDNISPWAIDAERSVSWARWRA
ncbi:MAG: hypothetical protein R3293_16570 [Candidatus Promineifilaceae bacterium]|nr:hypothetical protein [Candidatus Promineifilaceae bacterium]